MLERKRISILLSGMLFLGCSNAVAMGKKPVPSDPDPTPVTVPGPSEEPSTSSDPYKEGLEIGHRNGGLIVQRLKAKTIGLKGCSALGELEDALIKVSQSIQAPLRDGHPDKELARGFYRGYQAEVKEAIRESRHGCHAVSFPSGSVPGELAGAVLCQVSRISVDLLSEVEVEPLHEGWSGGIPEVIDECHASAELVLKTCGTDLSSLSQEVELLINLSCSDT